MNTAEQIFEQVKALPEPIAREVLDFVGYLLKEKQEQTRIKDFIDSQAGSMKEIWDNEADEAWWVRNKLPTDKNGPLLDLEAMR